MQLVLSAFVFELIAVVLLASLVFFAIAMGMAIAMVMAIALCLHLLDLEPPEFLDTGHPDINNFHEHSFDALEPSEHILEGIAVNAGTVLDIPVDGRIVDFPDLGQLVLQLGQVQACRAQLCIVARFVLGGVGVGFRDVLVQECYCLRCLVAFAFHCRQAVRPFVQFADFF